jgi:hypothetical protein
MPIPRSILANETYTGEIIVIIDPADMTLNPTTANQEIKSTSSILSSLNTHSQSLRRCLIPIGLGQKGYQNE